MTWSRPAAAARIFAAKTIACAPADWIRNAPAASPTRGPADLGLRGHDQQDRQLPQLRRQIHHAGQTPHLQEPLAVADRFELRRLALRGPLQDLRRSARRRAA